MWYAWFTKKGKTMNKQLAVIVTTDEVSAVKLFDIGNSYDMLREAVGGWIECVRIRHDIDMWLNEEGKLNGLERNNFATALFWDAFGFMSDIIVGDVIFTSSNEEGETIGLNGDQVTYLRGWLDEFEIRVKTSLTSSL